jgi:hypothetical protein
MMEALHEFSNSMNQANATIAAHSKATMLANASQETTDYEYGD